MLLYTCNCTDCQRQTGSAFALNMPVRFKDFRILQGEPNGWHHTSPNGTAVISRFCGNCGTRLYGERDGRPETVSLRAGTLDDTSWLSPVAHFFTRSAQSWVQPAPGAQCFETQPNGWGSLLPAWRARWVDSAG
ncbi:GFA family protein [Bradyrhizobium sp. 200]|nr:GFA family protein [Bradyrhizobium sp. 200]